MQISSLFDDFNKLQIKYGAKSIDSVYGGGETKNPDICLVFMNPTARNVSSSKLWSGIKAPWIGTKNVWNMLHQLGFISDALIKEVNIKKPSDWTPAFAEEVYGEVKSKSVYITNLSKATQLDARHLLNKDFYEYVKLFKKEIQLLKPKIIIAFGNQVSSILLGKNIKVSEQRKKCEFLNIGGSVYKVFAVYYPVGQGQRNMPLAKQDIEWIMKKEL